MLTDIFLSKLVNIKPIYECPFSISVLDCQVGDWGAWSECDRSCGTGMMTRNRQILQAAQNGGKHCPTLQQKRSCQGYRCHGHHDKKILRGEWKSLVCRQQSPFSGIKMTNIYIKRTQELLRFLLNILCSHIINFHFEFQFIKATVSSKR